MGFSSASSQAIDTLSDVTESLVSKIALKAKLLAEHSGRTQVNLVDIVSALKVINITSRDLISYIRDTQVDLPFCHTHTVFPLTGSLTREEPISSISYNDQNIPNFLPPFPDSHTYLFTSLPVSHPRDPETIRAIRANEKRQIEEKLATLLADEPMEIEQTGNTGSNPFLSLRSTERRSLFESQ